MAKSSSFVKLVSLVILSMLMMNSPSGEAITCNDVKNLLSPCLFYVLFAGQVPPECCNGLQSVVKAANTTTDHQNVCSCLKSLASSATDDQIQRVASIPTQCGVIIPFNITRYVDCSKVAELI
ncbi:hypothetical protein M9H77_24382 [Catharanthus roseus]|uniref:Uncharacterized protein n=1 Tax=Catharanthus roseus TaxID=4058 RepID=A0ACC0AWY7_CATRO|nr:hypothetical protein M9H77_24382 [Catharanthus roseus]